jgi:lipid-A-disaccharide synthase
VRITIVAGEHSGDLLGAQLIKALRERFTDLHVDGIGGALMREQGCHCLFAMEQIAVMGLFGIIKHIPRILSIRHQLLRYCRNNPPDIFIGIDAPDFNLTIEKKLKQRGVKTIHYVSPTVWAWRAKRIHTIANATDLMLTLLPFEVDYYRQHHIAARYVGHPLADVIEPHDQKTTARQQLHLPEKKCIIALLPGSRANEINYLGALFLQTAKVCYAHKPDILFIVPMVNQHCQHLFEKQMKQYAPDLPIRIISQQSRLAMAASDVVLLTSGTATLEAMLLQRPMVVAYRMGALTYQLAKRLVNTKHIALPNIIASETLVPEFIQHDATVENCSTAVMQYLLQPGKTQDLIQRFRSMHQMLRCQASESAAEAVKNLLNQ